MPAPVKAPTAVEVATIASALLAAYLPLPLAIDAGGTFSPRDHAVVGWAVALAGVLLADAQRYVDTLP